MQVVLANAKTGRYTLETTQNMTAAEVEATNNHAYINGTDFGLKWMTPLQALDLRSKQTEAK